MNRDESASPACASAETGASLGEEAPGMVGFRNSQAKVYCSPRRILRMCAAEALARSLLRLIPDARSFDATSSGSEQRRLRRQRVTEPTV